MLKVPNVPAHAPHKTPRPRRRNLPLHPQPPKRHRLLRSLFQFPILFTDHIRFCAFDAGASHILLLFTEDGSHGPTQTPGGLIPPHDSTGRQHVGFAIPTDSLPAWREKLALENIPIESKVTWPRGGISLYFRDPDHHLLELLTSGVWTTF